MRSCAASRIVYSCIIVMSSVALIGCPQPWSLEEVLEQPKSSTARLVLSPSAAILQINDSIPVEASGGAPPYTYSVISGDGSFSGNVYTAPPAPGTARIVARDNVGATAEASFTIESAGTSLGITPSSQAVYTGESISFNAVGGTGPFEFSMGSNSSGGSINLTTGEYTAGSNSGGGSVTDEVVVTDTSDLSTATATITVQAKPLAISPDTITVYVNQSIELTPVGGDGSFNFSISTNGSGGSVLGTTYTAGPVPGTDTVTMTDSYDGRTRSATITVVDTTTSIDYAPTEVTNIVSSDVLAGSNFTAEFSIENNGSAAGSKPISWTLFASADTSIGGVDDRIAATGSLAATAAGSTTPVSVTSGSWPSEPGNYYLLVDVYAADDLSVADNRNQSAGTTQIYAPLTISPSVAAVYTGQSVDIAVSGGTGVYSYSFSQTDSGSPGIAGDTYTAGSSPGTDIVEVRDDTYPGWAPATATISVTSTPPPPPGDVEYVVSSFTSNDTTPGATASIGESFTLRNIGADSGTASISWAAYVSQDNAFGLSAGDKIVDSGTEPELDGEDGFAGGSDETSIPLDGEWPSNPGTYYVKVRESADDETTTNEWFVSNAFSVQSVSSDADYYVSSPPAGGVGVDLGDPISASFVATNQGTGSGSATVYWWAYVSSDPTYNSGDTLVDSGSFSALGAGASSGSISVNSGSWDSTGNQYLLVRLQAADEINTSNNLRSSSDAYAVADPGATEPEYKVSDISMYAPFVTTGSSVEETFAISNIGANGSQNVAWTAYASVDSVPDAGEEIGSGTLGPLAAGTTQSSITLLGSSWPGSPGEYYLILKESAPDETVANEYTVSLGKFSLTNPPDYTIQSVSYPPDAEAGTPVAGGFDIKNSGTGDGKKNIQWEAFLSVDTGFGSDDLLLGSGEIGPLAAGSQASVQASDLDMTSWPFFGLSYILIRIESSDDGDTSNDIYVSGATELYILDLEGTDVNAPATINDGAGKSNSPIPDTQYIGTLPPGRTLVIRGWLDDSSTKRWDTYSMDVEAGSGINKVSAYATWSTGTDVGELFIWDEFNNEFKSSHAVADREPSSGELPVYGWIPPETAYVGFQSYEYVPAGTEIPYTIYVRGE